MSSSLVPPAPRTNLQGAEPKSGGTIGERDFVTPNGEQRSERSSRGTGFATERDGTSRVAKPVIVCTTSAIGKF